MKLRAHDEYLHQVFLAGYDHVTFGRGHVSRLAIAGAVRLARQAQRRAILVVVRLVAGRRRFGASGAVRAWTLTTHDDGYSGLERTTHARTDQLVSTISTQEKYYN